VRRLPKDATLEVSIQSTEKKRRLRHRITDFFREHRIAGSQLAFDENAKSLKVAFYTRSRNKIRQLRKDFKALKAKNVSLRVKLLRRRDWFDKWKSDYDLIPIGSKITIVPLWKSKEFNQLRRIPIYLDPGSAFGSGTHSTSQLMIRLMEKIRGRYGSFLDIGAGTGILSVVASKLGASRLEGYEIDGPSAEAAQRNLGLNHCEGARIRHGDFRKIKRKGKYDLVAANLWSDILIQNKRKMGAFVNKRKFLLVSGILIKDLDAFKKRFRMNDFRCLKILRSRQWVALLYQKKAPRNRT